MKRDDKILEIKRLGEPDLAIFKSLIDLFNVVFEEDPSNTGNDANLSGLLGNLQFIALVAFAEREVAGGLTAYELPMYYADHSEVFLYDLAVKPEYQRMGIGKELIRVLKKRCSRNGVKEFFVMAHEEDEHAIKFYRSTGGKSDKFSLRDFRIAISLKTFRRMPCPFQSRLEAYIKTPSSGTRTHVSGWIQMLICRN